MTLTSILPFWLRFAEPAPLAVRFLLDQRCFPKVSIYACRRLPKQGTGSGNAVQVEDGQVPTRCLGEARAEPNIFRGRQEASREKNSWWEKILQLVLDRAVTTIILFFWHSDAERRRHHEA